MSQQAGKSRFEWLNSLKRPEGRLDSGLFLAEGVRFVDRAVACGAPIRTLVTCPALLHVIHGRELAKELQKRVEAVTLSIDEFRELSILGQPQGIAVVVEACWSKLPPPRTVSRDLWLGIDSIRMPGNLGTAIRTAHASGACGVIVIGRADPFDPRAVRATMGSIFGVELVRSTARALRHWVAQTGARVVGADGEATRDYRAVSYRGPTIFMLGGERGGLSPAQRALCDVSVCIPMARGLDSLNVTAAAAILLYEAHSQRNPFSRKRSGKKRGS